MSKGNEIQRWADTAMFRAEGLAASEGPKVYLLSVNDDPLGDIAAMNKMYIGQVCRNLDDLSDEDRSYHFEQVKHTRLKAPFESVHFHFLIEGVSRAFTHQIVRQRTAAFAQESMRFAVVTSDNEVESSTTSTSNNPGRGAGLNNRVALPPSIIGTKGDQDPGDERDEYEWQRNQWDSVVEHIGNVYNQLVESGMPAEDARGLLPHATTTRLHYITDLRALQDHAGNRLCTQAQMEWRAVWAKMIQAIREYPGTPGAEEPKSLDYKHTEQCQGDGISKQRDHAGWQFDEIAKLFRPICFQTGKCEFNSEMDRYCSIRERVELNHKHGIQPKDWEQDHDQNGEFETIDLKDNDGNIIRTDHVSHPDNVQIPGIKPYEWLADPNAARRPR